MRSRGVAWAMLCLLGGEAVASESGRAAGGCRRGILEGEVAAGQGFARPIGNGLEVMLQAIASGWILRVVPEGGMAGTMDYAELATPPYESVSPLSVSTDFGFRAQDAVGWNPRHFRFASDRTMFEQLGEAYRQVFPSGKKQGGGVGESRLFGLVLQAPEGTFSLLDARLAAGTADQAPQAASVALHFASTAHRLEAEAGGRGTPLGKLLWIRFRVALDLPAGFRAERTLKVEARPCVSGR